MCDLDHIFNTVIQGNQIPPNGVYLGKKRMDEDKLRIMSDMFHVEFGQTYTTGKKRNSPFEELPKGKGGFYTLYSGNLDSLSIPLGKDVFLICHTHPRGTQIPSKADVNYLIKARALGSPQRSSFIIPIGYPVVRFYFNSPAI